MTTESSGESPATCHACAVTIREAFRTWCRVAALSFGGPAGQIAVMHRIIVDEKKWLGEERFLHALNYCMLLPGPEAQQLATYIGWLMHGTRGGLMAGLLFILPGCVAILALSIAYASFQETTAIQALFFGLKPAVLAIVLAAVLRIGQRVLKNGLLIGLAAAAFVCVFALAVPFPAVIAGAALLGAVGGHWAPSRFGVARGRVASHGLGHKVMRESDEARAEFALFGRESMTVQSTLGRALRVCAIGLTLWFAPLVLLGACLGPSSVWLDQGLFFSKAAVVTFGGAYSVLTYVAQQAVDRFGWLQPGEMLDGLGMAETTPGPLIMVVQFVAFLGAYRNPGPFDPLIAGILGSLITTWVTFVPCFLWVFLGAPYIERLRGNRMLGAAMSAITAAVVGVILNLAVWFSLHTLFDVVHVRHAGPLVLLVPDFSTIDWGSAAIAALACVLTFVVKRGMALTLAASAGIGAIVYLSGLAPRA